MILSYNELLSMGFRIGRDVPQATVELAISMAELYMVKPSLLDSDFNALCDMDASSALIAGGTYTDEQGNSHRVAGLKMGIGCIAYAELLRMNITVTTFGSVQKNDEFSINVEPKEQIKHMLAVGTQYVREVCTLAGMKYEPTTGVNRETYFKGGRKG